ncbi:hypothetical protein CROQUDRAFT_21674, partial [Cronartium quercuum f. sp. fusiforme G11]
KFNFSNLYMPMHLPQMSAYPDPKSVLVLENTIIHYGGWVKSVHTAYLPNFSPELNPIELMFGYVK